MNTIRSKLSSFLSLLREMPARGLWPYTADPLEPGIVLIGTPTGSSPLILEGNSRHAIGRLQRALSGIDGRVLALDTGSVDLYTALADGRLPQEVMVTALNAANRQSVEEAMIPDSLEAEPGPLLVAANDVAQVEALLAHPVWQAMGGEELLPDSIKPGPAVPEDLPAYFARGGELTEEMKVVRQPLCERVQLVASHAVLFALISAVPLALISIQALSIGLLMILGCIPAIVLLGPQISKRLNGRPVWLPVLALALLLGAVFGVSAALITREPMVAIALATGSAVAGGWLAWLSDGPRKVNV